MNSLFTLGLKIEIFVSDRTPGATIAKPGMAEVRFPPRLKVIRSIAGPARSPGGAHKAGLHEAAP